MEGLWVEAGAARGGGRGTCLATAVWVIRVVHRRGARQVGFTQLERWMCFSPVKNNLADAASKAASGTASVVDGGSLGYG